MIVVGQDYPTTQVYGIKDIASWAVVLCANLPLSVITVVEDSAQGVHHFDDVLRQHWNEEGELDKRNS